MGADRLGHPFPDRPARCSGSGVRGGCPGHFPSGTPVVPDETKKTASRLTRTFGFLSCRLSTARCRAFVGQFRAALTGTAGGARRWAVRSSHGVTQIRVTMAPLEPAVWVAEERATLSIVIYKILQGFMFYVPLYKMCVGTAVHVVEASTLEQKSSVRGCRLPKSG